MDSEKKEVAGWLVFLVIAMLVIGAVVDYSGLIWKRTIGVASANADQKIFVQTQAYIQGKNQDLAKYHHEYVGADVVGRKAIAATIRHEFADFDASNVSDPDLRSFLITSRNQ